MLGLINNGSTAAPAAALSDFLSAVTKPTRQMRKPGSSSLAATLAPPFLSVALPLVVGATPSLLIIHDTAASGAESLTVIVKVTVSPCL